MSTLAIVKWVDAEFQSDPTSRSVVGKEKLPELETVGWVVRDDEHMIALAHEQQPGEDWLRGVTKIPRAWIIGEPDYFEQTPPKKKKR